MRGVMPESPEDFEGMVQTAARMLPTSQRSSWAVELLKAAGVPDLLAERDQLREERDEARTAGQLPRTANRTYDLRQRLNRGMRYLRDAEDIARVEMPGYPTADRIRSVYEQLTADVLEGKTSTPTMREQLEQWKAQANRDLEEGDEARGRAERAEAELAEARAAAQDFAEAASVVLIDAIPARQGLSLVRDRMLSTLASALAAHPSYSGEKP